MAISYVAQHGNYGTAGVAAQIPAGTVDGDVMIAAAGSKPTTSTGTVPAGWTSLGSGVSANGAGNAADTGDMRAEGWWRTASADTPGTTRTRTDSGTNSVTSFSIRTFRSDVSGATWDVAAAFGADNTGGAAWSATTSTNLDIEPGDWLVWWAYIPTDVTTPGQFSAHTVSASGITFGTVTENGEFDSSLGNDMGGFISYAEVTAGSATTTVTVTATAGGTTTNVYGPVMVVRLREVPPAFTTHEATTATSVSPATAAAAELLRDATASLSITPTAAAAGLATKLATSDLSVPVATAAEATVITPAQLDITDRPVMKLGLVASGTTQTATTDLTVAPATAAAATRIQTATAALTVSPATSASGSQTKTATASVSVTPTTAASGTRTQTATASVSVSPSTSAAGVDVGLATGSVTVTPTTAASAVRVQTATASLTVTPTTNADQSSTTVEAATADLTVGVSTAASATVIKAVTASITVSPATSQSATRITDAQAFLSVSLSTSGSGLPIRTASAALSISPGTSASPTSVLSTEAAVVVSVTTGADIDTTVPAYYFTPPILRAKRLIGPDIGYTVVKRGSVYTQHITPSRTEKADADYIYVGGHEYEVDAAEAALLQAAGYSVSTTTI